MRLAHLDCSSGVSGDKFLGALLDCGTKSGTFTVADLRASVDAVLEKLSALEQGQVAERSQATVGFAELSIELAASSSYGIAASSLRIDVPAEAQHRSFKVIREAIEASTLLDSVKTNAVKVFSYLAEAEALIHSVEPADVVFHEVGALDSIIDIVGVCAGLAALKIEAFYATPPALGSGTVEAAHGEIPVPAPATAALLLNKPTSVSSAVGELTTPTGAALLLLASGFGPVPPMTPELLGYGMGTRDIGQANICRLIIGEFTPDPKLNMQPEQTVLLESNIDHISPEAVGFAGEELLAEGALDVWITPIMMKKNRAALTLSLLASKEQAEFFANRMAALTGTLGVRVTSQQRFIADREFLEVQSEWGPLSLKFGSGRYRAEHDDIARIARENELEYAEVLERVELLIESLR